MIAAAASPRDRCVHSGRLIVMREYPSGTQPGPLSGFRRWRRWMRQGVRRFRITRANGRSETGRPGRSRRPAAPDLRYLSHLRSRHRLVLRVVLRSLGKGGGLGEGGTRFRTPQELTADFADGADGEEIADVFPHSPTFLFKPTSWEQPRRDTKAHEWSEPSLRFVAFEPSVVAPSSPSPRSPSFSQSSPLLRLLRLFAVNSEHGRQEAQEAQEPGSPHEPRHHQAQLIRVRRCPSVVAHPRGNSGARRDLMLGPVDQSL